MYAIVEVGDHQFKVIEGESSAFQVWGRSHLNHAHAPIGWRLQGM